LLVKLCVAWCLLCAKSYVNEEKCDVSKDSPMLLSCKILLTSTSLYFALTFWNYNISIKKRKKDTYITIKGDDGI